MPTITQIFHTDCPQEGRQLPSGFDKPQGVHVLQSLYYQQGHLKGTSDGHHGVQPVSTCPDGSHTQPWEAEGSNSMTYVSPLSKYLSLH